MVHLFHNNAKRGWVRSFVAAEGVRPLVRYRAHSDIGRDENQVQAMLELKPY